MIIINGSVLYSLGNKIYINLVDEAKRVIKEISIEETLELQKIEKEFILIDVRDESEWNEKRIPNSVYIGKGNPS